MILSAPVYALKRRARLLARRESIPLSAALDRVARAEGFARWSLLAARLAEDAPAPRLLERLLPGDLVLLAARPGQGKTLLGLDLLLAAARCGRQAMLFTLEDSEATVRERLDGLGVDAETRLVIDASDTISAAHIEARLAGAASGTVAVVDYLQLLDQRRENPDLESQVATLRAFTARSGAILVLLSQVDRRFDPVRKPLPDLADVRLPNRVDFRHFTGACFMNAGRIRFDRAA